MFWKVTICTSGFLYWTYTGYFVDERISRKILMYDHSKCSESAICNARKRAKSLNISTFIPFFPLWTLEIYLSLYVRKKYYWESMPNEFKTIDNFLWQIPEYKISQTLVMLLLSLYSNDVWLYAVNPDSPSICQKNMFHNLIGLDTQLLSKSEVST